MHPLTGEDPNSTSNMQPLAYHAIRNVDLMVSTPKGRTLVTIAIVTLTNLQLHKDKRALPCYYSLRSRASHNVKPNPSIFNHSALVFVIFPSVRKLKCRYGGRQLRQVAQVRKVGMQFFAVAGRVIRLAYVSWGYELNDDVMEAYV
jgi:hypothetical protein